MALVKAASLALLGVVLVWHLAVIFGWEAFKRWLFGRRPYRFDPWRRQPRRRRKARARGHLSQEEAA